MTRRAVGIKHTMAGCHGIRMQSLNLIERARPLASGLFIALGEIGMRVVIDGVARYDQANRRTGTRTTNSPLTHPYASEGPFSLDHFARCLPADLAAVVARCLAKDPHGFPVRPI